MARICRFTFDHLSAVLEHQRGEIKLGERINLLNASQNIEKALEECHAEYVLVGVPENIGVKAKTGRTNNTLIWEDTLKNLLNLQDNDFNNGAKLCLLGHLDFSEEMEVADTLDINHKKQKKIYYQLVEQIDKEVSHLVFTILKSGKLPIIVGGGQNNSYGAIKGAALASGHAINAINFDAYSHFLLTEGRHSGNSFSYAFEEGFLKKYFVFGLHENYTSKGVLDAFKKESKKIRYSTYEEMIVREEKNFKIEIQQALKFLEKEGFGIDVDLDATTIFSGESVFSSGFHARELRQFVNLIGKSDKVNYFQIAEGSSVVSENNSSEQIGKLISILIMDFIKSHQSL